MTATAPLPSSAPVPTDAAPSLEMLAADVQRTLDDVRGMPIDHRTRALALKDALEAFHKAGLTTIVRALKQDPRGKELLFELVDDPGVYALLALHGIVKADVRTRVARVVENLRPYTQSHGGDVTLVDVSGNTVYLRLSGACNGCSMSSVTLRNGVEEALREQVPEITAIEVVPNEPDEAAPLVTLTRAPRGDGWIDGPLLEQVHEARPYRHELDGGRSIVILRLDDSLTAYWNECAHMGLPIDGGLVDREARTITCPWHGFCFDCTTGECLSAPEAQLEALPVRVDSGRVQLRPT
ncbi:NifU family protein [Gemmatimonas aurantiaca]|uniref:NifU family protein n=1 Tax=Gemmatimonas aurantiaca TaxID=173480 RepID=UPI00301CA54E